MQSSAYRSDFCLFNSQRRIRKLVKDLLSKRTVILIKQVSSSGICIITTVTIAFKVSIIAHTHVRHITLPLNHLPALNSYLVVCTID